MCMCVVFDIRVWCIRYHVWCVRWKNNISRRFRLWWLSVKHSVYCIDKIIIHLWKYILWCWCCVGCKNEENLWFWPIYVYRSVTRNYTLKNCNIFDLEWKSSLRPMTLTHYSTMATTADASTTPLCRTRRASASELSIVTLMDCFSCHGHMYSRGST